MPGIGIHSDSETYVACISYSVVESINISVIFLIRYEYLESDCSPTPRDTRMSLISDRSYKHGLFNKRFLVCYLNFNVNEVDSICRHSEDPFIKPNHIGYYISTHERQRGMQV